MSDLTVEKTHQSEKSELTRIGYLWFRIKRINWWFWILTAFFLAVIAICYWKINELYQKDPKKETIDFEILKSLLQIITVLILGQVISLIAAQLNFHRQRRDARIAFQREILQRLIRSYTAVKKHRRLLRAKGLNPPYVKGVIDEDTEVFFKVYDEQMQLLNETELEIEVILHEVESAPYTFSDPNLTNDIERMKDYLRRVIQIYEQKHNKFIGSPKRMRLDELILEKIEHSDAEKVKEEFELKDFVKKTKGSDFKKEFINTYYKVSKVIRNDILT